MWAAGAVTVPIYDTSSAEQIRWIVEDSAAVGIIVENDRLKAAFDEVAAEVPACTTVLVIDDGALVSLAQDPGSITTADVESQAAKVVADDVATIVYTSGTTGRQKGCVLTHRNLLWEAQQTMVIGKDFLRAGTSTLLFLPLAHIFARAIQVGCVEAGVRLGYSSGVSHLLEELVMFKPDFLLAVPRVFEKVYNGAKQKAHDESALTGLVFDRAASTAIAWSRSQAGGGRPNPLLAIQHRLYDALVYRKLRAAMGGRAKYAVSGGAALGDRLGHFFHGAGILILEGYGLTETTAGAFMNRKDAFRIGTVGLAMPGTTGAIAEDGEILLKGAGVFTGYHGNPQATAEVIDEDGWFHTGDLGDFDADGFLRITGRKKEILVTAGGKNVAPAVLEDRLRAHPLVSQAMVVGDGEPFIAALVTIDPEAFEAWTKRLGKGQVPVRDLVDDDDLRAEVQHAVDDANSAVSKAESIRTFRILPEDFVVGVELSQKQSIMRHVVSKKYAEQIAAIYAKVKRI
ncbi:MAG: long-chain acyl-CoA synthetase [Glaciecola sp.]